MCETHGTSDVTQAGPCCNNPIFAEIVPAHMRNMVYAFDRYVVFTIPFAMPTVTLPSLLLAIFPSADSAAVCHLKQHARHDLAGCQAQCLFFVLFQCVCRVLGLSLQGHRTAE